MDKMMNRQCQSSFREEQVNAKGLMIDMNTPLSYQQALSRAFDAVDHNIVNIKVIFKRQCVSYCSSTHQVHKNKTQYDMLTLTFIFHNNVFFYNPECNLDHSSTDLVRLVLITFVCLCPLRPARKV